MVEIIFGKARAIVELLEEEAPESSNLVWSLLPLEGKPFHTIESGREVFLRIPEPEPNIVPENQTVYQVPGDVFIYSKPIIYIEPDWPEIKREAAVISFCYGRDTQVRGLYLPLPVSIIGKIVNGLEQLEDEAARLRNEGVEKISFTRYMKKL